MKARATPDVAPSAEPRMNEVRATRGEGTLAVATRSCVGSGELLALARIEGIHRAVRVLPAVEIRRANGERRHGGSASLHHSGAVPGAARPAGTRWTVERPRSRVSASLRRFSARIAATRPSARDAGAKPPVARGSRFGAARRRSGEEPLATSFETNLDPRDARPLPRRSCRRRAVCARCRRMSGDRHWTLRSGSRCPYDGPTRSGRPSPGDIRRRGPPARRIA